MKAAKIVLLSFIGLSLGVFIVFAVVEIVHERNGIRNAQAYAEIRTYNFLLDFVKLVKFFGITTGKIPSSKEEVMRKYKWDDDRPQNLKFFRDNNVLTIIYFDPKIKKEYKIGLRFADAENFETIFLEIPDSNIFNMKDKFVKDSAFWNVNLDKSKIKAEENKK